MKQLWTGNDLVRMALLRSELDAKGIPYTVRNEALRIAMGELPPMDIWPEIWITDEARFGEAEEILRDLPGAPVQADLRGGARR
jgi:hypothetical protein